MSANFIVEYGGLPVRFPESGSAVELVQEHKATRFSSDSDAWLAAYGSDLLPARCRVINLYQRNQTRLPSNQ